MKVSLCNKGWNGTLLLHSTQFLDYFPAFWFSLLSHIIKAVKQKSHDNIEYVLRICNRGISLRKQGGSVAAVVSWFKKSGPQRDWFHFESKINIPRHGQLTTTCNQTWFENSHFLWFYPNSEKANVNLKFPQCCHHSCQVWIHLPVSQLLFPRMQCELQGSYGSTDWRRGCLFFHADNKR